MYVCMYVCMVVCMVVCMYVCMVVCMYVCMLYLCSFFCTYLSMFMVGLGSKCERTKRMKSQVPSLHLSLPLPPSHLHDEITHAYCRYTFFRTPINHNILFHLSQLPFILHNLLKRGKARVLAQVAALGTKH